MSSDDYQVQNIYRYSRKTYKKNRRQDDHGSPREEDVMETPRSEVRSDGYTLDLPGCSCDVETEGDIASILHKKCPVISLAQQQLQRLLDGTDKLLCDNTRCCRSFYDFLCICREAMMTHNKCQCALMILIALAFFLGLIFGAASCGSYLGRFNSPILGCIDSYFIPNSYPNIKDSFRSVV
ncbi:uncharacterized protein LOC126366140 [Pectinophora gossypiella]|uniref:uncharacterized protein LOC126366140 n=1 Tax=Pectinophora gossypiella TaxID=13191 RepID=UPI00214EEA69|nr:uncharacterized protein LOC126366140 [Pectinophora gossypiella]